MSSKRPSYSHRSSSSKRRRYGSRRQRTILPAIPFFSRKGKKVWLLGALAVIIIYIWAFYFFFVGPTGFRWRALYGPPSYPEGYEIHGIDISHFQGKIDWDRLHANATIDGSPVRFIIVKATEGASKVDANFNDNFSQIREYGFIRGAYHFWSNKSSAREQAYFFLKKVHLENGDLPPVLDIEHAPSDLSIADFQTNVLTWLHIVEDKYHVTPIIYTYYKFKQKYLSAPVFDDYPYWIAHYYVDKVEYKGKWKFWQHTDRGVLPGIKGNVDFNIYNGSYYDLLHLTIGEQEQVEVSE